MKILLINPPYPKLPHTPKHTTPPLGLAYIAAVLEQKYYHVEIIDCVVEGFDTETDFNEIVIYGMPITQLINYIEEYKPDVIGISCMFSIIDSIIRDLSRNIKEKYPGLIIVLGGTHATVMAEQLIREPFVDYIVRGEGEHAFLELIEYIEKKRAVETVRNLTWINNGKIFSTPQVYIQDIDKLPLPARHLLNIEEYIRIGHRDGLTKKGIRTTTLITSRGCPAKCIFCSIHTVWGYRFRRHSQEYSLNEIKHLREKYGIEHLIFQDDNLTLDKNRAEAIFTGIIDSKYHISWTAPNGIAIWALDDELLKLIKKSGCYRFVFAVESGDPVTLKNIIHKPLQLDKVNQIVKACRNLRIPTTAFFVIGLPGETMEAMKRSMKYAENLDVGSLSISIASPYPGTPLYEICEREGYLIDDFQFDKLSTRIGQIRTPDFGPGDVEKLLNATLIRHGIKHPIGVLRRIVEQFKADPRETVSSLLRRIGKAIHNQLQVSQN